MKTLTKLAMIAVLTAIGTSVASADDQQHRNRLDAQRAESQSDQRTTTVAVYAGRHSVSQRETVQNQDTSTRFELRSNAHGQLSGAYTAAN